jgi:hypothetical protein
MVYAVLYIHTSVPEYSEILGVYDKKKTAVGELLERANYRKNREGLLTQYLIETDEYESYESLYEMVYENMELSDIDIYRICKLPLISL